MPSASSNSPDSLFSVELYIDRIRLNPSADCLFPATLFKLLDFGTQRLSECPQGSAASSLRRVIADYERTTGGRRKTQLDELRDSDGNLRVRRGKSALFRMQPDRLAKCLSSVPMYVFLIDAYHQPPKLTGVCTLALDGLAQEVLQHQTKHGIGVPVAREISGVFGLASLMGHEVGLLTANVRLASLGSSVAAHLPAPVAPPEARSTASKAAVVTEALATAAATQTSGLGENRSTQYPFPVSEATVRKNEDESVWLEDADGEGDSEEVVDELPDTDFGDINDLAAAAAEAAEAEALAATAVFRDAGCGPVQPPPMFYNSRARKTPKKGGLPWTSDVKQPQQKRKQQPASHKRQTQTLGGQKKQQQQQQQQKKKKQPTAKSAEDAKYGEVVRRLTQRHMQGPPEAAVALYTRRQIQQGRMPLLHGLLSELLAWSGEADAAAAAAAAAAACDTKEKRAAGSAGGDGEGQSKKSLRFLPRPLPPRHRRRSAGDYDSDDEDSLDRRIRLGRSVSLSSLVRHHRHGSGADRSGLEYARPEREFLRRLHDGQSSAAHQHHQHDAGQVQHTGVPPNRSWIREAPRYRGSPATRLQFGLTATCVRRLSKHNPAALAELLARQQEQQQQQPQKQPASRQSAGDGARSSVLKKTTKDRAVLQRSAPTAVKPRPSPNSPAPLPAPEPPQPTQSQQRPQPQAKPRIRPLSKETLATTTATSATSMTSAASQHQQQPQPPPSSVPPLALQRSEDSVATVSGGDEVQSAGRPSSSQQQRQKQRQQQPLPGRKVDESSDWQVTASAPSSPMKPPLPATSGGAVSGGSPAHRPGRRLQQPQQPTTPGSNATAAISDATQVTPDASFTGRGSGGETKDLTDSERRLAAQLSSGSLGSYQPSWMDDSLSDHASVSTSIEL